MAVPKAAAKLREYLADPEKVVVCPGVHDGLTARVALSVGFDALYMVSLIPLEHIAYVLLCCR